MENYYYKGYRVWSRKFNHKFINNYICSGVLLINLKELRKNNITQQYQKFIKEKGKKLIYHDEFVINYICSEKIGFLPPKFGTIIKFGFREGIYPIKEKIYALKNPDVIHFMTKPWRN